jgi:hypothetical protein
VRRASETTRHRFSIGSINLPSISTPRINLPTLASLQKDKSDKEKDKESSGTPTAPVRKLERTSGSQVSMDSEPGKEDQSMSTVSATTSNTPSSPSIALASLSPVIPATSSKESVTGSPLQTPFSQNKSDKFAAFNRIVSMGRLHRVGELAQKVVGTNATSPMANLQTVGHIVTHQLFLNFYSCLFVKLFYFLSFKLALIAHNFTDLLCFRRQTTLPSNG